MSNSKKYFNLFFVLGIMILLEGCLFQETPYVPLEVTFTPSKSIIQAGDTVNFTNRSQVAASFVWDFGDSTTSAVENPQRIFTDTGRYVVTLIGKKRNNQTTDTLQTNIIVLPNIQEAADTKIIGADGKDMQGQTMTYLEDGNLVLVGRQDLNELRITKTNDGNTSIWQTDINNISKGQVIAKNIKELSDNTIVIVGYYFDVTNSNNAFVLKLDQDGEVIWMNKLNTIDNEIYQDFVEVEKGSIIVLGSINQQQVQLDKYSDIGVLTSSKTFGETYLPESILVSKSSEVIVSGSNLATSTPFLLKTSLEFKQEVFHNLDFSGKVLKTIQLADGAFVVVGSQTIDSSNKGVIAKINATTFDISWKASPLAYSQASSEESFVDIVVFGNDLIVLGTHTNIITGTDVLICKYTGNGTSYTNTQLKVFGGPEDDQGKKLIINNSKFSFIGDTRSFSDTFREIYFATLTLNLD